MSDFIEIINHAIELIDQPLFDVVRWSTDKTRRIERTGEKIAPVSVQVREDQAVYGIGRERFRYTLEEDKISVIAEVAFDCGVMDTDLVNLLKSDYIWHRVDEQGNPAANMIFALDKRRHIHPLREGDQGSRLIYTFAISPPGA